MSYASLPSSEPADDALDDPERLVRSARSRSLSRAGRFAAMLKAQSKRPVTVLLCCGGAALLLGALASWPADRRQLTMQALARSSPSSSPAESVVQVTAAGVDLPYCTRTLIYDSRACALSLRL